MKTEIEIVPPVPAEPDVVVTVTMTKEEYRALRAGVWKYGKCENDYHVVRNKDQQILHDFWRSLTDVRILDQAGR